MPNIVPVAITVSQDFIASAVSANFSATLTSAPGILQVINNRGLDSDNYETAFSVDSAYQGTDQPGFQSNKIAVGQIIQSHLSNSEIRSNHIDGQAIINQHFQYASVAAGVQVLRAGPTIPQFGVEAIRITQTIDLATWTGGGVSGAISGEYDLDYSNAIEGDPGFKPGPVLAGMPIMERTVSSGTIDHQAITNSNSVSIAVMYSGTFYTDPITATVHAMFIGNATAST